MTKNINIARWLLRVGLAFVLAYAAVEAKINPSSFLFYVPDFVNSAISPEKFLPIFSIGEGVLVIWLITGWQTKYPAILTALLMTSIVVFNLDSFSILFRNVAIGFSALALAFLDSIVVMREDYKATQSAIRSYL